MHFFILWSNIMHWVPLVESNSGQKNLWSMEPLVKQTLWSKEPSGQKSSGQKTSGQWDSGQKNSGQKYPLVNGTLVKGSTPCELAAATCTDHQGGNASQDLKDWFKNKKIETTVTSIFSFPCQIKTSSSPLDTNVSKKVRSKLQSGQLASNFSDEQIKEFFEKDLGKENKAVEIRPIPEGEVAFIFCKVKGRKSDVQVFIDNGCNCAIVRDGIPQDEFRSCLLRKGPIRIDVATGVKVEAQGEWATALPLNDGSFQPIRSLSVTKVTSDMPTLRLEGLLDKIKEENKGNHRAKMIRNLKIPSKLGGEIDAIIGIQFKSIYPEEVFTLPSGLTIYKSKFLPAKKGETACIGGPLGALDGLN